MKYKSIKPQKKMLYEIRNICGKDDRKNGDFKDKLRLEEIKNIWNKGKVLKTRPALRCGGDNNMPLRASNKFPLTITDTVYYYKGKKYNIAYYSTGDYISFEHIYIFLVNSLGDTVPLGFIPNYRLDYTTFYFPDTIFFLVGEKTVGEGIYAFLKCSKLNANKYVIYELESDFSHWLGIGENNRYIPTILLNGHGNLALEASERFGLELKSETAPEKRNIINSYFTSCFTSDGLSWSFQLPVRELDRKNVTVRVYFGDEDYLDFNIPVDGGDTKEHEGRSITAYCNLNSGRVYFMSNGTSHPIPQIPDYPENNIVITAQKKDAEGEAKIVGSRGVTVCDSRAYFFGNSVKPNEIYSCKISSPTYFPSTSKVALGSETQKIVTAGYQNNKLIVFKEGEIYKVSIKGSSDVLKNNGFSANEKYVISDMFSGETISTKTGCMAKETVAYCTGQLVWLGSDKKVYTLEATTYGSEKNIFELSEKIDTELKENIDGEKKLFAFSKDGYYYLFSGNKAFVCDCHITNMGYARRYGSENAANVSWYIWDFPHKDIITGRNCGDIVLGVYDLYANVQYFASFCDASDDKIATGSIDGEYITEEHRIEFGFKTNLFDMEFSGKKQIDELFMAAEREDYLDALIFTDKGQYRKHIHNKENEIRINPGIFLKPAEYIGLYIKGNGKFLLDKIAIKFKAVEM